MVVGIPVVVFKVQQLPYKRVRVAMVICVQAKGMASRSTVIRWRTTLDWTFPLLTHSLKWTLRCTQAFLTTLFYAFTTLLGRWS